MSDLVYELDPKGDIFLVLDDVPDDFLGRPWYLWQFTLSGLPGLFGTPSARKSNVHKTIQPDGDGSSGINVDSTHDSEPAPQRHLQIRASSKHLTLACPQFERTLQNGFQEGTELRATGCLKFPVRDWEAKPFLILMLIIHHRTSQVPRLLSLDRLVEVARLVDYYECYEAVEVLSSLWVSGLTFGVSEPKSVDEAEKWLFVSWVFNQPRPFLASSKYLESRSTDVIAFRQLPVPSAIQDAINGSRRALIARVVASMHDFLSKLQTGPVQCCEGCDCMRLGALTKGMHRIGILSLSATSTFEGISLTQLAQNCRNIDNPKFCDLNKVYHQCNIQSTVDPLLKAIESSIEGLSITRYANLRPPFSWSTSARNTVKPSSYSKSPIFGLSSPSRSQA
ncbi:hypothetical protein BDV24DRAFT_160153 [Aspergillus arachidicola]|uniref:BTB domain-containing protein n=1 Tax=Aspergillus arachidicola TaxID=656916 RepID=A0A2G7FZH1_9EURO|nr:hypothetical protein BDV24DRAFT_160153 [Aspergillus arachidicola]PIG85957.1 hypothetical protein AARAC_004448 [Aspergillus arachidicola]